MDEPCCTMETYTIIANGKKKIYSLKPTYLFEDWLNPFRSFQSKVCEWVFHSYLSLQFLKSLAIFFYLLNLLSFFPCSFFLMKKLNDDCLPGVNCFEGKNSLLKEKTLFHSFLSLTVVSSVLLNRLNFIKSFLF